MADLQVVILYNGGSPELWIGGLIDGTFMPAPGTGPIREREMPDDWKQFLKVWKEKRNG